MLICTLFASGLNQLKAQWENTQFHLGGSYDFLRIKTAGFQTYANYFTISGGANYVFWQSNDQVSLSANPNASIGVSFNNFTGLSFFGQAPVFAMLRVGAASTKYNQQKFGLGVGAGFVYAHIYEKGIYANNRFYTLQSNIINPAVAAQITFQNDFRILTIRAYSSVLSYSAPFIEIYGDDPYDYDMFGISLLYNF
jgi:hypothetical protein